MSSLLLGQLASVRPEKLGKDERLAFWLNVYNGILMHVRAGPLHFVCPPPHWEESGVSPRDFTLLRSRTT